VYFWDHDGVVRGIRGVKVCVSHVLSWFVFHGAWGDALDSLLVISGQV
jgi:hypothetical protein